MAWKVNCSVPAVDGPIEQDKTLVQGDSWEILVNFNEVIADLVVRGEIRTDYQGAGTDVLTFLATTADSQEWSVLASPVDTAGMAPENNYVYDLEYAIPSRNVVQTFLRGKVKVIGQVTDG